MERTPAANAHTIEDTTFSAALDKLEFYHVLFSSANTNWQGLASWVAQLSPVDSLQRAFMAHDTLALLLKGSAEAQTQLTSQKKQAVLYPANLCLQPKNSSLATQWDKPLVMLYVQLDSTLLATITDEVASGDPFKLELIEAFNFRDPLLHQLGLALLAELETGGLVGRMYVEALATVMALHLIRNYSSASATKTFHKKQLSSQQLQRLDAYIKERLNQELSLAELAQCAGLSPFYFTRLFKQTTGMAPHQYLIKCRIERAKTLLEQGHFSLMEISQMLGFADQSHFSRHFKKLTGVSPRALLPQSKILLK